MPVVPTVPNLADGVVDSSTFNNYLIAAANFLLAPPVAELRQTTLQSVPNATWTALLLDTEDTDTAGGHSTSSDTSRYTAVYAGWYEVSGGVSFATNTTGRRACWWKINGLSVGASESTAQTTATSTPTVPARVKMVYLAEGDYVELGAYQDSGISLNTAVGSTQAPGVSIRWVSN